MRIVARVFMKAVLLLALVLVWYATPEAVIAAGKSGVAPKSPERKAKPVPPKVPVLDTGVGRQLQGIRVRNAWKHIVIHHTATRSATAKGIDRFHRERRRMENGMAYHFLIGNGKGMKDGEIFVGRRWKRQIAGGHLASEALNESSIGICLVGNFEEQAPTAKQLASLRALTDKLRELTRLPATAVTTHRKIHPRHTSCPGKHFRL